jgi:hypothetical protein
VPAGSARVVADRLFELMREAEAEGRSADAGRFRDVAEALHGAGWQRRDALEAPEYPADSRIAHALRRLETDHPEDPRAQAMSLRAELHYSAFLTTVDRCAFRAEIERREVQA